VTGMAGGGCVGGIAILARGSDGMALTPGVGRGMLMEDMGTGVFIMSSW
jgi:hypothetical protein